MCVCTRMGNDLNKPARTRHTCLWGITKTPDFIVKSGA